MPDAVAESTIGIELLILFGLTLLNGIFAMSEAALLAARRTRLRQMADRGDKGAQKAVAISEDPNRFLSTVQIFITLIGILGGAFGGATLAGDIADRLKGTALEAQGAAIGVAVIVLFTSYLSLIIGELVPKRLALLQAERIASLVASPMNVLSHLTAPIVRFLGFSTDAVLRLLRARTSADETVTPEDIEAMVQEGVATGHIDPQEQRMLAGIFRLSELRVDTLMTPRSELAWLDVHDGREATQAKLVARHFARYPVVDGGLEHLLGVVETKDLLPAVLSGSELDLRALAQPALYLPDTVTADAALARFREHNGRIAFIIDEYGSLEGILTSHDILDAIIEESDVVVREDGSYLLDGQMPIDAVQTLLALDAIAGAGDQFQLLSGFIMAQLSGIPAEGDHFEWKGFRFEVVDMDGRRIDKVLVEPLAQPDTAATE